MRIVVVLSVVAAAAATAGAADAPAREAATREARFSATLTGRIARVWTVQQQTGEGACAQNQLFAGGWQINLRTTRAAQLVVTRTGSRLRVTGRLTALTGAVAAGGSARSEHCDAGGTRVTSTADCLPARNEFRGATATPVLSGSRLVLRRFGPRAQAPHGCPPAVVTAIASPVLDLARATVPTRALMDPKAARIVLRGDYSRPTRMSGPISGVVTDDVHWVLTLRRVGGDAKTIRVK